MSASAAPPQWNGNPCSSENLRDPVFCQRWLNAHLSMMSLFCFVSFYIIVFAPGSGAWLFLASLISLVGVSVPSCCCPTQIGWKVNILFQFVSATLMVILFLGSCIALGRGHLTHGENRALAILLICNILSVSSSVPIIQMSRYMLDYNAAVVPDIPMPVGSAAPGQLQPAPQYVIAHAQVIDPSVQMQQQMQQPMGPPNGAGWEPATASGQQNMQYYSNVAHNHLSAYSNSASRNFGGQDKAGWVDQNPTVVAVPVNYSGSYSQAYPNQGPYPNPYPNPYPVGAGGYASVNSNADNNDVLVRVAAEASRQNYPNGGGYPA